MKLMSSERCWNLESRDAFAEAAAPTLSDQSRRSASLVWICVLSLPWSCWMHCWNFSRHNLVTVAVEASAVKGGMSMICTVDSAFRRYQVTREVFTKSDKKLSPRGLTTVCIELGAIQRLLAWRHSNSRSLTRGGRQMLVRCLEIPLRNVIT